MHPNSNTVDAPALSIAGVDPELGFAGGETQVLGLTIALAGAGHRAELICDPAGRLWERAIAAGIRCHPLRIRNAIDLSAGIRLRAILKRERYDVVHFHTSRAHSMAPFARGFARALVVTRRMDYRPNRVFAPYLYNRAVDGVVAISGGVADSLAAAGVDRQRVTVVPSGVDCGRFRPPTPEATRRCARIALGISDGEFVISAVGALEPRKGHRYLIEAVAQLAITASSVKLKCFIAGQGSIRGELERAIAQLGCTESVKLLGRIDDPRELLWASDVFAMPSLKEGLGVAALEAMASALPVIASDVGGLREVVEDDRTGIIVPPANPEAIASAIGRLAQSTGLRSQMGAAARARAVENYSMATMAARTLALYRACVRKTREKRKKEQSHMKSMTGFGRAIAEQDGTRVIAEVRALNQRFFELKLAVPRGWGEHEAEIRKTVQNVVARGRVEIFIKSVALKPPPVRLEVNDRLANLYVAELRRLGKQLHLNGNPDIGSILNRPEIFHVVEEEHDSARGIQAWPQGFGSRVESAGCRAGARRAQRAQGFRGAGSQYRSGGAEN